EGADEPEGIETLAGNYRKSRRVKKQGRSMESALTVEEKGTSLTQVSPASVQIGEELVRESTTRSPTTDGYAPTPETTQGGKRKQRTTNKAARDGSRNAMVSSSFLQQSPLKD